MAFVNISEKMMLFVTIMQNEVWNYFIEKSEDESNFKEKQNF